MPLVTIIIPVYNTQKYLKKCLDSVVNQTYKNIEIILINDASSDNSLFIMEEYKKNFKKIKLVNKLKNTGLSDSRNIGLEYANGEFIYFLDSDDWIKIDTIEKLLYLIKTYETSLAIGNYAEVIASVPLKFFLQKKVNLWNLEENKDLLYNDIGSVWNKLYSHKLIENLRFPTGLWYEDNAFNFPLLAKAKQVVKTNEIFYFYRRHIGSITLTTRFTPTSKVFDYYEIAECLIDNFQTLNLYESYKEQIFTLAEKMIINPLLIVSHYSHLSLEDKHYLLYLLSIYMKEKYGIETIENHPFIKNKMKKDLFYKIRIKYILKSLEQWKKFDFSSLFPLEEAKRILAKYKR